MSHMEHDEPLPRYCVACQDSMGDMSYAVYVGLHKICESCYMESHDLFVADSEQVN